MIVTIIQMEAGSPERTVPVFRGSDETLLENWSARIGRRTIAWILSLCHWRPTSGASLQVSREIFAGPLQSER